jgi:hypothetical protein
MRSRRVCSAIQSPRALASDRASRGRAARPAGAGGENRPPRPLFGRDSHRPGNHPHRLSRADRPWPGRFLSEPHGGSSAAAFIPRPALFRLCIGVTAHRGLALPVLSNFELLLENQRRSADPFPFQADIYFDTVGDLDEGNAFVHAVVLAIESHSAVDASRG